MAQKKHRNTKNDTDKSVIGSALIFIAGFFLLCLIIPPAIGPVSLFINSFIIGVIGFIAFPLFLSMLLSGVALIQKRSLKVKPIYVVGIIVIVVFVTMILQLATSQIFLELEFMEYIAEVYASFTAGGIIFGSFVYAVNTAIPPLFAYIFYSLAIAATALFMAKDKIFASQQQVIAPQQPPRDYFVKGMYPPRQVTPLPDTTLFVGTIDTSEQWQSNYNSQSGNFSSLKQKNSSKNLQQYSTSIPSQNIAEQERRAKVMEIWDDIKSASPTPIVGMTKPNDNYILPPVASSQPDIKTITNNDPALTAQASNPALAAKKPPIVLHIEDYPELQSIALPPPKDVSDQYIGGVIINGEKESKRLAEERAAFTSSIQSEKDRFDTRKSDPPQITLKAAEPAAEPKINLPPITNGDYFSKKPQSKDSFSIEHFENHNILNNTKQAPESIQNDFFDNLDSQSSEKNKTQNDLKPIFDDFSTQNDDDLAKFESGLKNILNRNRQNAINQNNLENDYNSDSDDDSALDYNSSSLIIDEDEPAIDLSERSFSNNNDNTGYYVEDEPNNNNFATFAPVNKKPEPPKPQSTQIKLDEYAKNISSTEKPKVKKPRQKYSPPPIDLLYNSVINFSSDTESDSSERARILEETLRGLKLPATVSAITRGPSVTRYELEMPPGIPVKRIEQFVKDIEYNLASNGRIRIETPIPGKRAVGIEVPNELVDVVGLKEIIGSKEFSNSTSPLTLALGKDIAGANILCCLDKMPHLLIAGATGSGKSACLNSIIISMLYKSSPDDVRIILIDPKHVEFTIYRDMPHLLTNEIITDSQQALNAFKWTKQEMDRRYILFSQNVVRNLSEYNKLECVKNGEQEKLPNIVLIVDELAELMISNNRKDLEEKIMSMSQKARAAGIHLILATQRPSVDVITGTIKANLPSRIAFAVKSIIDSRTILDQSGAETLLGKGDMLYAPLGVDEPRRVQGSYVTNEEVAAIVDYVRENNIADFDEDFMDSLTVKEEAEESDSATEENEFDPLMQNALKLVIETGNASTSFIQRRFAIGYARAARIMDQMAAHKFVGPLDGNKPRIIFITREQYKEMFGEDI